MWQGIRRQLNKSPLRVEPPRDGVRDRVFAALSNLDATGATAQECWSACERKLTWIREHREELQRVVDNWTEHDKAIDDPLAPATIIHSILRSAGADEV